MSSVLPLIAVIVTVIAGWALIKRVQTHMVLFICRLGYPHLRGLGRHGLPAQGSQTVGFLAF